MFGRILRKFTTSPTLLNWVNQFSIFIHGIFITSLILINFPNLEYSFWMLLKTLTAFGLLAEAGLGRTIERSVAFFYAGASKLPKNKKEYSALSETSGDPNVPQLAQLLYTIKFIYLLLSAVTILLLATAGVAILWNLFTQSNHDRSFWIAFALMIVQSSFILQSIKWRSFMAGTKHLTQLYRATTIFTVLRIFGFLALLLNHLGIEYLMGYLVVEQAVTYIYMRRFMVRWFKSQNFILKKGFKFDKSIFASLWSVSWKTGLNTWGFFFSNRGVELIISQLKDTTLMASFLFTNTILRFIRNIAQTPVTVKYPEMYGFMSGKKFRQVKDTLSPRIFLSMSIMVVGFVSFGLLGNWLLDLIGAEDKSIVPVTIFAIMSVYLILESQALIMGTIYISTNDVPFLVPGLITGAATYILGSFVLPKWGLLGLITLQMALNLGNNFWYSTYLSLKLIHWPLLTYIRDVAIEGPRYWISRIRKIR